MRVSRRNENGRIIDVIYDSCRHATNAVLIFSLYRALYILFYEFMLTPFYSSNDCRIIYDIVGVPTGKV